MQRLFGELPQKKEEGEKKKPNLFFLWVPKNQALW
jgi:hypothetical protein